jgi:FkbH-like protein
MKLIEALELERRPAEEAAPELNIFLACGFTPLHLRTFLSAHLRQIYPESRVRVEIGLFGDLIGNIERLARSTTDVAAVVIEWGDLDPRLAARSLGGWRPADLNDIVESAARAAGRLLKALIEISHHVPVIVCMPTLPLPPMFSTPTTQASAFELRLRQTVAELAASLADHPQLRVVSAQALDEASPPAGRYDFKSDVDSGFPYSLQHASATGGLLAGLIHPRPPKKGLITDLDDTLWGGILGEDHADGISWHLDRHTHLHGLYQQFLASLGGAGILIGVASKNDAVNVDRAFERQDLLLPKADIFPFEVHWSAKSKSVERILATWNISADSVVFIDDSPMEVGEVKAVFPNLECIVFPKADPQALWALLRHLREAFGKPFLTDDDSLRLRSIQDAGAWREAAKTSEVSSDNFLKSAEASIKFDFTQTHGDTRAFELVNKTNQFNLNGKRFSEAAWRKFFGDPAAFLLSASYEDKYGPSGKIAVILGKQHGRTVRVESWVMSCRAFSRRIEHQCLQQLFDALGANEIVFDFEANSRNAPLERFFAELLGCQPSPGMSVSKERFAEIVPALFHRVERTVHV